MPTAHIKFVKLEDLARIAMDKSVRDVLVDQDQQHHRLEE